MVDIKGISRPVLQPEFAKGPAAAFEAQRGSTQRVDKMEGGATPAQQAAEAVAQTLGAPPIPEVALASDSMTGAHSFGSQLQALGPNVTSSEALLAQFLKLQILDASQGQWDQAMINWARSLMLGADHSSQQSERLDYAESLHTRGDQLEAKADQSLAKGQAILDEAGISRGEVESLYHQSVAAGGDGSDIVQRWRDSRPEGYDPERLAKDEAALNKAMPHANQAEAAMDQAESLRVEAGAIFGSFTSGLVSTATIRAGTPGYKTMLRVEEHQKNIANAIRALLSEERPDKRLVRRAWVEIDQARNAVAKLVLQLADKHVAMTAASRTSFHG